MVFIISAYCQGISLSQLIKNRGCLPEPYIAIILKEILLAVSYLHGRQSIHGDIRSANILIEQKNGNVKLCDFGVLQCSLGEQKVQLRDSKCSTYYMAPEGVESSAFDQKTDIWSIGISAIEMALGTPPHSELRPSAALKKIIQDDPPSLEGNSSKQLKEFVNCCLRKNPHSRPSAAQMLSHYFIKLARKSSDLIGILGVEIPQKTTQFTFKPGFQVSTPKVNSMPTGTNVQAQNKPGGGSIANYNIQKDDSQLSAQQKVEQQKGMVEFLSMLKQNNKKLGKGVLNNMDKIIINIEKSSGSKDEKEKSNKEKQSSSEQMSSNKTKDLDGLLHFLFTDSSDSQDHTVDVNQMGLSSSMLNSVRTEQEKRHILEGMSKNNQLFKSTLEKVFDSYISYSKNTYNKEYLTPALQNLQGAFKDMEQEESGSSKQLISQVFKGISSHDY